MAKKTVRSAKGVAVDFDLIKIKEQMATAPVSVDVKRRQNFIENRLRRRAKKKLPVEPAPESVADVEVEPEIAKVEKAAPMIEEPAAEPVVEKVVEKAAPKPAPKKKTTKKKATPKKKTTQRARPVKAEEAPEEDTEE